MLKGRALALTIVICIDLSLGNPVLRERGTPTPSSSISKFPETAGVTPIPCHSHNDYLREHPLIDALSNGCISVEADIWQEGDMKDDLRVGHAKKSLKDDRTLKTLYINPIIQRLQAANGEKRTIPNLQGQWNGMFAMKSNQTLVLLIDFKTGNEATWSTLMNALKPFRDGGWLSHWDLRRQHFQPGPITMVASGASTLDEVMRQTFGNSTSLRRDIFLDAPLANLGSDNQYNRSNSYYASTNYGKSADEKTIKSQIAAARKSQLISRYWNAPDDYLAAAGFWPELKADGVGIFNTDHLTHFKDWWSHKLKIKRFFSTEH